MFTVLEVDKIQQPLPIVLPDPLHCLVHHVTKELKNNGL